MKDMVCPACKHLIGIPETICAKCRSEIEDKTRQKIFNEIELHSWIGDGLDGNRETIYISKEKWQEIKKGVV